MFPHPPFFPSTSPFTTPHGLDCGALQVQKRLVPGILAPLFEIKYGFGFANFLSATKFMFFNWFL